MSILGREDDAPSQLCQKCHFLISVTSSRTQSRFMLRRTWNRRKTFSLRSLREARNTRSFPARTRKTIIHEGHIDRKSTRLNSSHQIISYAVFCLKKKNTSTQNTLIFRCYLAEVSRILTPSLRSNSDIYKDPHDHPYLDCGGVANEPNVAWFRTHS